MRLSTRHEAISAEHYSDPNYVLPVGQTALLGTQHILAMFAGNITPALIIAGAVGLVGADQIALVQAAILCAGFATLMQSVGFGPIGARLPVVSGASFAFIPLMIPIAKTLGLGAVFGGALVAGIFQALLGSVVNKIRHWLPPIVTGIVLLTIGAALIPVGIKMAAGGVALMGTEDFGSGSHWLLAALVIGSTLGVKFFAPRTVAVAGILVGIIIGYFAALLMGKVSFDAVADASWFSLPRPFAFGLDLVPSAVLGLCLMVIVSCVETVGDITGITSTGGGREPSDREIAGGTIADGLSTSLAAVFGGLPTTSFSQNVGLVAMTGVMSRHVATFSAVLLLLAGVIPKVGGVIVSIPTAVLGGGVIMMFGMVAAAGLKLLGGVVMNPRNMLVIALSLAFGLGFRAVPDAVNFAPHLLQVLLTTGVMPAAFCAIVLNRCLPLQVRAGQP